MYGDWRNREHEHREDHLIDVPPPRHRNEVEADREEIDEEGSEGEIRDRYAGDENQDDARVREAVAVERRRRPQKYADGNRQEQGREREDRRDGEASPDHVDDGHAREAKRHAEAPVRDIAQIAQKLHSERPVEAVVGAKPRLKHGVAGMIAEQRRNRIARHELGGDEGENDGEEKHGHEPDQATYGVADHLRSLGSAQRCSRRDPGPCRQGT